MNCSPPGSLSKGFPRQEYWSGLPFPSPGDLPNPGIGPTTPALAVRFFTTEPPGKPTISHTCLQIIFNQIFDCVLTSINIFKSVLLLSSDYSKCRRKRRHKQESREEKDIFKKHLSEVDPPWANV